MLTKQDKQRFAKGDRNDQQQILKEKLEDQYKVLKSSQDMNTLMSTQGTVRLLEALLSSFD